VSTLPRYRLADDPAVDHFGADTSWTLTSFAENNAENPDGEAMCRTLARLSVGERVRWDHGAGGVTEIVRVA
jgi:hypothetical protein